MPVKNAATPSFSMKKDGATPSYVLMMDEAFPSYSCAMTKAAARDRRHGTSEGVGAQTPNRDSTAHVLVHTPTHGTKVDQVLHSARLMGDLYSALVEKENGPVKGLGVAYRCDLCAREYEKEEISEENHPNVILNVEDAQQSAESVVITSVVDAPDYRHVD